MFGIRNVKQLKCWKIIIPNYTCTEKYEQMYKQQANGPDKLRYHKQSNDVGITDTAVPLNCNLQSTHVSKIHMQTHRNNSRGQANITNEKGPYSASDYLDYGHIPWSSHHEFEALKNEVMPLTATT
jgi:hypothetical protein